MLVKVSSLVLSSNLLICNLSCKKKIYSKTLTFIRSNEQKNKFFIKQNQVNQQVSLLDQTG